MDLPSNVITLRVYTTLSRTQSSGIEVRTALSDLPQWDSLEGVFGFYLLCLSNFIQVSILLGPCVLGPAEPPLKTG